jgi:hypothetical protein
MTLAGAQSDEIVGGILSILTNRKSLDDKDGEKEFLEQDLFTSQEFRIKSKITFQSFL